MSRCEEFQSRLTWWLDGELAEPLREELQQHLSACLPCQEALEIQQRGRLWLKENDRVLDPRPELWQKIRRSIREQSEDRRPGFSERLWNLFFPQPLPRLARVWAGLAMTALMAASGLLLFNPAAVRLSADREVRQMMENYVQWREVQKPFEIPGVNLPVTSIEELRLANPFLDENNGTADRNPFEI